MRLMTSLAAAGMMMLASASWAAAPDAAQVKAVQDMLASMQAEKMMRQTAGASRYASETQREAVFAKLDKVPAAQIHARLAGPVAKLVSTETALEMTKFYASTYGQRVLQQAYNSGPSMYGYKEPQANAAEKAFLKKPAMVQARKAFAAAEPAIRHEAFVLLKAIAK